MSKALPTVRLGEVLTPVRREESVDPSKEYRLLGVRLDGNGPFLRESVTGSQTAAKKLSRVAQGDFIYSRLFACRGAFGVIDRELDGCYVSGEFPVFAAIPDRVDVQFLRYWFRLPAVIARVDADCSGSTPLTRNRFNERYFVALEIPLPPLAEQRRVVARIEQLAERIHEARALRQETTQGTQAFWASSLTYYLSYSDSDLTCDALPEADQVVRRGAVSPVLPNAVAAKWQVPKGWRLVSVAELLLRGLLLDVKDGNHGSNHPRSSEFREDGAPFLMASDLQDGKVLWNSASRLGPETITRLKVGFALKGDVLFTHKASVGKTAIAEQDCILSPQVTYYRCNVAYIEPRWLRAFLGSPLFLLQLADIKSQTTRDFVSIGKQYQQFILLPPVSQQRRIADELDALQFQVTALKCTQTETAAELDALLPAILDRAFKGELV